MCKLTSSLGGLSFGYDESEQKYGYYVTDSEGADTFYPFKKGTSADTLVVTTSSFSANNPSKTFEIKDGYNLVYLFAEINGFSDIYKTASTSFSISKNVQNRTISVGCVGSIKANGTFYAVYLKNE